MPLIGSSGGGSGLTTEQAAKLAGIAENANAYAHPNHSGT